MGFGFGQTLADATNTLGVSEITRINTLESFFASYPFVTIISAAKYVTAFSGRVFGNSGYKLSIIDFP
jgi:hypothetical protein